jgi:hypothetical protein
MQETVIAPTMESPSTTPPSTTTTTMEAAPSFDITATTAPVATTSSRSRSSCDGGIVVDGAKRTTHTSSSSEMMFLYDENEETENDDDVVTRCLRDAGERLSRATSSIPLVVAAADDDHVDPGATTATNFAVATATATATGEAKDATAAAFHDDENNSGRSGKEGVQVGDDVEVEEEDSVAAFLAGQARRKEGENRLPIQEWAEVLVIARRRRQPPLSPHDGAGGGEVGNVDDADRIARDLYLECKRIVLS